MAWVNVRTISIDHTKCGTADSTNFPVLISGTYAGSGTDPDLRTTGNGGQVTDANGYDIAFFSDSGLTTMLDFERVAWSATTGAVEFWVEVPTISYTTDTVIYIAYGNASITTDQQNKTGTWNSNFVLVDHLN